MPTGINQGASTQGTAIHKEDKASYWSFFFVFVLGAILLVAAFWMGYDFFNRESVPEVQTRRTSAAVQFLSVTAPVDEWAEPVRIPCHVDINWWGENPAAEAFETGYVDPDGHFRSYRGGKPEMRAVTWRSKTSEPETVMYEFVRDANGCT